MFNMPGMLLQTLEYERPLVFTSTCEKKKIAAAASKKIHSVEILHFYYCVEKVLPSMRTYA